MPEPELPGNADASQLFSGYDDLAAAVGVSREGREFLSLDAYQFFNLGFRFSGEAFETFCDRLAEELRKNASPCRKMRQGTILRVLSVIVSNLIDAFLAYPEDEGLWVAISRSANTTAYRRRNVLSNPYGLNHKNVRTVLDALEERGLVEQHKGFYDRQKDQGAYTRVRATPALRKRAGRAGLLDLRLVSRAEARKPLVKLKGSDGQPQPLPNERIVRVSQKLLERYNAFMAQHHVTIEPPDWATLRALRQKRINPNHKRLQRVFSGSLDKGGRFYGGFWQHVPSHLRHLIRIDGEPTVELDFQAMQPHLLYSMHGKRVRDYVPGSDPYVLPGLPVEWRPLTKHAFLMCLNAESPAAARRAVHQWLHTESDLHPQTVDVERVFEALFHYHPLLYIEAYEGIWGELQMLESEVAFEVLDNAQILGIPILPIHDGFIGPQHHLTALRRTMAVAYCSAMPVSYTAIPTIS